jgi:hypothetical protein
MFTFVSGGPEDLNTGWLGPFCETRRATTERTLVMNLNSIGNTNSIAGIFSVGFASNRLSFSGTSSIGQASQASISPLGELMAKLQQLQQQDPSAFKEIAGELSTTLRQAIQKSGDSDGFLSQLANGLTQAAQTGDMSALQPPDPSQGRGVSGPGGANGPPPLPPDANTNSAVTAAFSTALEQVTTALAETGDSGSLSASSSSGAGSPQELVSKLQELATKDPDAFKQIVSTLASNLEQAQSSSSESDTGLSNLISTLKEAAATGDSSLLQPQSPPPPPMAQGSYGGSWGSSWPRDITLDSAVISVFTMALTQLNSALGLPSSESTASVTK